MPYSRLMIKVLIFHCAFLGAITAVMKELTMPLKWNTTYNTKHLIEKLEVINQSGHILFPHVFNRRWWEGVICKRLMLAIFLSFSLSAHWPYPALVSSSSPDMQSRYLHSCWTLKTLNFPVTFTNTPGRALSGLHFCLQVRSFCSSSDLGHCTEVIWSRYS